MYINQKNKFSIKPLLSSLLLIVIGVITGLLLGSVYIKTLLPRRGMGWDQIADALGSLMVGSLLGLVLAIVLIMYLDVRGRLKASGVLFVVALLTATGLTLTHEPRKKSEPVVLKTPFKPWYRVKIRVGNTKEILIKVKDDKQPIPFTEVHLWTAIPEIRLKGWGPEFIECYKKPSKQELRKLLPFVIAASKEGKAGSCFHPERKGLNIPYSIKIDGEHSKGTVQGDCIKERKDLIELTHNIQKLAEKLCS